MPRPSMRDFFANWRTSDMSAPHKVAATLRNTVTKVRKRQNCCGNHGEPGC